MVPAVVGMQQSAAGLQSQRALRQLRELISVMRLFKGGGIGLGPYAFVPTGEDCWRRLPTGAPATRPGAQPGVLPFTQKAPRISVPVTVTPPPGVGKRPAAPQLQHGEVSEMEIPTFIRRQMD